jgi:ATP-binding cassette subfamily B protein
VVIAHRLGTLRRADEVAVLDGGRLVEWGPRALLAGDRGSRLYALLRAGTEQELLS